MHFHRALALIAGIGVACAAQPLATFAQTAARAPQDTTTTSATAATTSCSTSAVRGLKSADITFLFNDRHVASSNGSPEHGIQRASRALIEGACGGNVYLPARALFEGMGATVTWDPGARTFTVARSDAQVRVTVGKAEVVVNGQARPLDVPPIMYRGVVFVPVRVLSEGMGAYVQWIAEKRLVVIRYLPPTPPPAPVTPAPTAIPTVAPTATPAPTPTPFKTVVNPYIAADVLFAPKVYNEFNPGNSGHTSGAGRVGATVDTAALSLIIEANYRYFRYSHDGPSFVTTLGGVGSAPVDSFDARDTDFDGQLGIGIANPKIFIVGAYDRKYTNYGYPVVTGPGAGIKKVPNFNNVFDVYGSALYFPTLSGDYIDEFATHQKLKYSEFKYQAGAIVGFGKTPIFLDLGFLGDHGVAKENAPSDYSHNSLYAGLGLHF